MSVSGSVLTDTERRSLLLALQSVLDYLAANTSHLSVSHLTTTECHLNNQLIDSLSGHSTEKIYQ